jgi:hypothetical protein
MGLGVRELLFFDRTQLFQQKGFVVFIQLINGIEQLNDLEVFVARVPLDIQLKIPFFRLLQRTD